ncbi:hypothetical protein KC333_g588 [Hortaea werneckii]|nr:hypothetical protein KC333_g588 [Hortaea werneckii]KAI7324921.1 hypothetical protein KC326_g906 [Hortaea werneckii]
MNLFEAILGSPHPQKVQQHQHNILNVRHVGHAELLFNRLGESYTGMLYKNSLFEPRENTNNAEWIGQDPAGLSVSFTYDYTTIYWKECSLKHMEVEAKHKVDTDMRAVLQQEKQRVLQEINKYERREEMAKANPIPKWDAQFPGVWPPENLALDEDELDAYISELEGQLDDCADDDVYREEAVDFLTSCRSTWVAGWKLGGTNDQYNITAARCFAFTSHWYITVAWRFALLCSALAPRSYTKAG